MKKIILFSIAIIVFSCKTNNNEISDKKISDKKVKVFLNNGEELYLKTNIHGIAGNHEQIILSNDSQSVFDKNKDYIFYSSEIYYKTTTDSIIIYAPECCFLEPESKIFKSVVSIIGLKNADEIDEFEKKYKRYNLKRLSVY